MASSGSEPKSPSRLLRMLLCGHIGSSREDFAYVLGPVIDELLRRDIRIEITEVPSAGPLLEALAQHEHDLVCLMFHPSIHENAVALVNKTHPPGHPQRQKQMIHARAIPRGCEFIRLVRKRTLKPVFIIQDGTLLREAGQNAVMEAGADAILNLPFSALEFEAGLRRFLHASAFRRTPPQWPAPLGPGAPQLPAPTKRFCAVSAIQVAAIRHTFATCVRTIESCTARRAWLDCAAGAALDLLHEPGIADAGLVVVQLNNLEYPEELSETGRYLWLISELRARTAGFVITLNAHWHTPEALRETEAAGADLALPVPFEIEEAFEAVKLAHAIWNSGG